MYRLTEGLIERKGPNGTEAKWRLQRVYYIDNNNYVIVMSCFCKLDCLSRRSVTYYISYLLHGMWMSSQNSIVGRGFGTVGCSCRAHPSGQGGKLACSAFERDWVRQLGPDVCIRFEEILYAILLGPNSINTNGHNWRYSSSRPTTWCTCYGYFD